VTFNPRLTWKKEDDNVYYLTEPCARDVSVFRNQISIDGVHVYCRWRGIIQGTERELRLTGNTFTTITPLFTTPEEAMCCVEGSLAREGLVKLSPPKERVAFDIAIPEYIKLQIPPEHIAQAHFDALFEHLFSRPLQQGEKEPIGILGDEGALE
jgi:hypothetical protein